MIHVQKRVQHVKAKLSYRSASPSDPLRLSSTFTTGMIPQASANTLVRHGTCLNCHTARVSKPAHSNDLRITDYGALLQYELLSFFDYLQCLKLFFGSRLTHRSGSELPAAAAKSIWFMRFGLTQAHTANTFIESKQIKLQTSGTRCNCA